MAYYIEIKCRLETNKYVWRKMRPTGGSPYQYNTKEEAEAVARKCYPDHQDFTRVTEGN